MAVHCTNFRDFATDRHRTVDDTPFGGGPGMVLKIEPVVAALEHVEAERGPMHRVLLSPAGRPFDQAAAERLARLPRVALLCGRYEGFDDRVRTHYADECLSIGDYVLGGGEVAALVVIEAVSRLCEGVVGNPESVRDESHATDDAGALLEPPHYARPASFRGLSVPDVLLSGDHVAIARWRGAQARARTWAERPELRRHVPLPAAVPLWLALPTELALDPDPADPEGARAWARLVAEHDLAGVAGVGPGGAEWAARWARGSAGKTPASAFARLARLRRQLARTAAGSGGGGAVAFLRAVAPGPAPEADLGGRPGAAQAALDALRAQVGSPGAVVLGVGFAPGEPWHAELAPLASGEKIAQSPAPRVTPGALDPILARARAMWDPHPEASAPCPT